MNNRLLEFIFYGPKSRIVNFYVKNKLKIWFVVIICVLILVFWTILSLTIDHYEDKLHNKEGRISSLVSNINQLKEDAKESPNTDRRSEVVGKIVQCADLVTTKIHYRQIANMTVERGEIHFVDYLNLGLLDGKLHSGVADKQEGGRIIMPVDVTIDYGFDISGISIDNVKIDENSSQIWVYLPRPKIINTDFKAEFKRNNMVLMAPNKFAMEPTTEEIDRVINEQTQFIISECKKNLNDDAYSDIVKENAKNIFGVLLKKMGYKNVSIEIVDSNLKH